jgi:hypothetical protein
MRARQEVERESRVASTAGGMIGHHLAGMGSLGLAGGGGHRRDPKEISIFGGR